MKRIKDMNKEFLKASPAEQRMMIAEDVLARIAADNICPIKGFMFKLAEYSGATDLEIDRARDAILQKQIKEYVNRDGSKCRVCAKGALFISLIGEINNMTFEESHLLERNANNAQSMNHRKLSEYFDLEQLDLIEIAYEGKSFINECADYYLIYKAKDFYAKRFASDEERLEAIMLNIIENQGEFKP